LGIKADDIADRYRLFEQEGMNRDSSNPAAGTTHGGDRPGHINLSHDPAAEDITILIEVSRHGHYAQGGLLVGESDAVNGHDEPFFSCKA
jgi:hypothetical protein